LNFIEGWLKARRGNGWFVGSTRGKYRCFKLAKRRSWFLQIQFQALIKQLLHFFKKDEGFSTHPHLMCYEELGD
jgi:DNA-binding GntR family transcriptional regulator